jgi:uncharacterized protein (TIGR02118 family)
MSVRITVFYTGSEDGRFDFDYYTEHHVPMVYGLLEEYGCRRIDADRGVAGGPGQPAPYPVIAHMEFDSIDGFETGMAAHGKAILRDVPKYTDLSTVTQISEIELALPR